MCTGRLSFVLGMSLFANGVASAQTTERASVDSNGIEGNGPSGGASSLRVGAAVSADGRYVAFGSTATNLVPGDTNGKSDVFVRDRLLGTTERVSVDSSGAEADDDSGWYGFGISADGRYVVFDSFADNLVAGDTNATYDIFVRDRSSGTTVRASVATGGAEANSFCIYPSISADGRWVSFLGNATNLVPGDVNGFGDIFVHDLQSGTTSLASVDSGGAQANHASFTSSISGDGRYVAFVSWASNLGPVDANGTFGYDVFVHDCVGGSTAGVSVDPGGAGGNGDSDYACISADGRFVTFETTASNLMGGNPGTSGHILVRDLATSTTSVASMNSSGELGNYGGAYPTISGDGRYVAFVSISVNFAGGSHGYDGIFVRDRQLGTIERVSVDASGEGGDNSFGNPAISGDGLHVAFGTDSTTLVPGDTNGVTDAYVHDALPAAVTSFCLGDGSGAPCPCANSGSTARGCQNSASTGGALLGASGHASLGQDSLRLSLYGARTTALSVFVQGDAAIPAALYGDGLRCVGGSLKRLYVKSAQSGMAFAPRVTDVSVSSRSAALGDPITAGQTRYYFVYYRDPAPAFCPDPPGSTWNDSNALSAVWDP